ncbi:hypothetical protein HMPREF0872_07660 [Veillonella montpellierensis DNF00314]|uniref:Uncharacterized protein n=1 Tax=Veillonella montpellierensis DNF00314 TaxID=1401067 RepID=A0A096AJ77_9FIRM|nr:hypothetical protein [Veillonella montpellierensis]KGF46651.1 hypothetical protein HMPREF0872_07660 [Veillonella montpellierensis DNF00314]
MSFDKIIIILLILLLIIYKIYKIHSGIYDKKKDIPYNHSLINIDIIYIFSLFLLAISCILIYSPYYLKFVWIGNCIETIVFFIWSYIYWKSRNTIKRILELKALKPKEVIENLDSFNFKGKTILSLFFSLFNLWGTIIEIIKTFF